jgi:hypothetical protein
MFYVVGPEAANQRNDFLITTTSPIDEASATINY